MTSAGSLRRLLARRGRSSLSARPQRGGGAPTNPPRPRATYARRGGGFSCPPPARHPFRRTPPHHPGMDVEAIRRALLELAPSSAPRCSTPTSSTRRSRRRRTTARSSTSWPAPSVSDVPRYRRRPVESTRRAPRARAARPMRSSGTPRPTSLPAALRTRASPKTPSAPPTMSASLRMAARTLTRANFAERAPSARVTRRPSSAPLAPFHRVL